jgi:OmcA/MtrC family decaheme c-type cytochrome
MRAVALQGYWNQVSSPASSAAPIARHALAVVKPVKGDAERRSIVDAAKCGSCHEWFAGHGGNRIIGKGTTGTIVCMLCHVPGLATSGRGISDAEMKAYAWSASDKQILGEWGVDINATNAALKMPATSNNMKDMIHGIHAGRERVVPFQDARNALPRAVTLLDFRRMDFPGTLSNCTMCHTTSTTATKTFNFIPANTLVSNYESINAAYAAAITAGTATPALAKASLSTANATDSVRTPWGAACSSCHDNAAAKSHMQLNGAVMGGARSLATGVVESCTTCHGPGADFDAATVHQ